MMVWGSCACGWVGAAGSYAELLSMGHNCCSKMSFSRTFVTSRMAPDGVDLLLYEARNMKALEAVR